MLRAAVLRGQRQRRHLASLPVDDGAGQWPVGVGRGARAPGFQGVHDAGGVEALLGARLDTRDAAYSYGERQTHALLVSLVSKRVVSVDQLRRAIEALHPEHYATFSYYEKWAAAMARLALEARLIDEGEWSAAVGAAAADEAAPLFKPGDRVVVREASLRGRWRTPHLRVPGYCLGAPGVVERACGTFPDPEVLAFSGNSGARERRLYRVRFRGEDLWPDGAPSGDTVDVEVYDHWLRPAVADAPRAASRHRAHHHGHASRGDAEAAAVDAERPSERSRLTTALVEALAAKGVVTKAELREAIERIDALGTNAEGPRLVARAWTDAAFKDFLLRDATAAAAALGIEAANSTAPTVLTAVENTATVHNLVVCTLCSCYPLSILGLSPPWYKHRVFRARAVREPRALLRDEFGLDVDPATKIRVHDSTADLRYIVIPRRPRGTDHCDEADLAALVTRDAMIGVAEARAPGLSEG